MTLFAPLARERSVKESQFVPNFDPCLGPDGHGAYRLMRWVNGGLVRRFLRDLEDPEA